MHMHTLCDKSIIKPGQLCLSIDHGSGHVGWQTDNAWEKATSPYACCVLLEDSLGEGIPPIVSPADLHIRLSIALMKALANGLCASELARMQVAAGRLPLAPGSVLTWLGFTDAGALAAYDSEVAALYMHACMLVCSSSSKLICSSQLAPGCCSTCWYAQRACTGCTFGTMLQKRCICNTPWSQVCRCTDPHMLQSLSYDPELPIFSIRTDMGRKHLQRSCWR